MCIRDRVVAFEVAVGENQGRAQEELLDVARRVSKQEPIACLLYTSDAADDLLCVDLGGRRIIKKKKQTHQYLLTHRHTSSYVTSTLQRQN